MKAKKTTAFLLILVLALQLLPVKQVFLYFFAGNAAVEEFVNADKGATKNLRLLDEDHNILYRHHDPAFLLNVSNTGAVIHFDERLPARHSAEVQTPPPNIG